MGQQLNAGNFYSTVAASDRRFGFVMSELTQPTPRKIPHHSHELPYFTLVVSGYYNEGDAQGTRELRPMTAAFNPCDCSHWGAVGQSGARMFTVEVKPESLTRGEVRVPDAPVADLGAGDLIFTALRLYRVFRSNAAMEPLTAEALVCELIAAAAKYSADDRDLAPKWWSRVQAMLHEQSSVALRIAALANEAGVHPVHLARVFRKRTGTTPGEHLQRIRVQNACARLMSRERSLADVAFECGFADQAHMTRLVRRFTGTTPAAMRATFAQKKSGRS